MRTVKFLLQKEFLQIFRNKAMLPIMFVMPVIQLILLAFAITYEVKDIEVHWVDYDRTQLSSRLSEHLAATGYFRITDTERDLDSGVESLLEGDADIVVVVPDNFEANLRKGETPEVQCLMDGVQGTVAGVSQSYLRSVITKFNRQIKPDIRSVGENGKKSQSLLEYRPAGYDVISRFRYNPELDYQTYMVPGILVVLVSMIGVFLSGMNIVRERELGTIEQLNVTPIKRWQFITGKLLPFWIIGLFELTIGLIIAKLVFDVPFVGSIGLIYVVAAIYLAAMVGLGLFISTVNETQQQAMFLAWFFMVVFILLGGLFTPIESMPSWAQKITWVNPVAYFVEMMRMIMLKGSGIMDMWKDMLALTAMAFGFLFLSVNRYKKASG